jgi:hypothetical protein
MEPWARDIEELSLQRHGFLNPPSTTEHISRELLKLVPFSTYFFSNLCTKEVVISIFERFDNREFGLQKIEFLMSNDLLQFKQATIQVKTSLAGFRWLMQEWFFSTVIIVSTVLTHIMCGSICVFVLGVRKMGYLQFL